MGIADVDESTLSPVLYTLTHVLEDLSGFYAEPEHRDCGERYACNLVLEFQPGTLSLSEIRLERRVAPEIPRKSGAKSKTMINQENSH